MLIVQEFDNRLPGISIIDIVSETWCIDDSEVDLERLLLEFCLDDLDLYGLV